MPCHSPAYGLVAQPPFVGINQLPLERRSLLRPDHTVISDSLLAAVAPVCDWNALLHFFDATQQSVLLLQLPRRTPTESTLDLEGSAQAENTRQAKLVECSKIFPNLAIRTLTLTEEYFSSGLSTWIRDTLGWTLVEQHNGTPKYVHSSRRSYFDSPPNLSDFVGGELVWPDGAVILSSISVDRLSRMSARSKHRLNLPELFASFGREVVTIPSPPYVNTSECHADMVVGRLGDSLFVPTLFPAPETLPLCDDSVHGNEWLNSHMEETDGIAPLLNLGRRDPSSIVIPEIQKSLDAIANVLGQRWHVVRIPTPVPIGLTPVQQAYNISCVGMELGLDFEDVDEDDLLPPLPASLSKIFDSGKTFTDEELDAVIKNAEPDFMDDRQETKYSAKPSHSNPWWRFFSTANFIARTDIDGNLHVAVPWPRVHASSDQSYEKTHLQWVEAFKDARSSIESLFKERGVFRVHFIPCDFLNGGMRCLTWEMIDERICEHGDSALGIGTIASLEESRGQ